jgi:hypothetical protein
MARSNNPTPVKLKIYFTDFFGFTKAQVERHGAFNISLLADLPLFVDPFLLFNSRNRFIELSTTTSSNTCDF